MHDLSLYVLELIENSVRAGADTVVVTVAADPARDELTLGVDDDGPGLDVSVDEATDPFYTTKQGKRTGLGLPLFREAAEAAGGHLTVHRAGDLGGVGVTAVLRLSHVDRPPLGDMVQTVAVTAATTPDVELRLEVAVAGEAATATGAELVTPGPAAGRCAALLATIDEHPADTGALAGAPAATGAPAAPTTDAGAGVPAQPATPPAPAPTTTTPTVGATVDNEQQRSVG